MDWFVINNITGKWLINRSWMKYCIAKYIYFISFSQYLHILIHVILFISSFDITKCILAFPFFKSKIENILCGLPAYLVHGSHEKLNSLCIYLFPKILSWPQSLHQFNSYDRQFLLKLNPEFFVIVRRKVCLLAVLPVF